MERNPAFQGFTPQGVKFLEQLKKHNEKDWFSRNKAVYEQQLLSPAKALVVSLGKLLKEQLPGIKALPELNQSIFKIYRDIRFSPDKSPFKTYLGIFWWEGKQKKLECSGFYFHLEPPDLMLAAGMHTFSKPMLEHFRKVVSDPKKGEELKNLLGELAKKYAIGGKFYKKIPPGFKPDSPAADLLLYNGLYAYLEQKIPAEFYQKDLVNYACNIYLPLIPLHRWLAAHSP